MSLPLELQEAFNKLDEKLDSIGKSVKNINKNDEILREYFFGDKSKAEKLYREYTNTNEVCDE